MYTIYKITSGDTLESIATLYNVDPAFLYELNNFDPSTILTEGMNIIVPNTSNQNFSYYTIKQGDSIYKIARDYNIDPNVLAKLNGLNMSDYIYPNQTIMIPKQGVAIYITKENDTLNNIANSLKTNISDLIKTNQSLYLTPDQIIIYRQ